MTNVLGLIDWQGNSPGISGEERDDLGSYRSLLKDSLAGALVDRVDTWLALEERSGSDTDPVQRSGPGDLSYTLSDRTVDDLTYLARALHRTRAYRRGFANGRTWARRSIWGLVVPLFTLVGSMLIDHEIAYKVAVASLAIYGVAAVACVTASGLAWKAFSWLEDKAQAPDAAEALKLELESP
jgi:hypothetical protein